MKKILVLFALILLLSCDEIHYDGAKRLVFKTIILDANGAPLRNSHVEIEIQATYSSDIISIGETNANGEVELLFPLPKNDFQINLRVYNIDETYMEKEILNLRKEDFVNYKLEFPSIYLLKNVETAPLNITYNPTTPNTYIREVSIVGIYHLHTEFYNYTADNYYENPSQFLVKKNQTFQLKYTLLNSQTNVQAEHSVDFQIGTDALDYTLTY